MDRCDRKAVKHSGHCPKQLPSIIEYTVNILTSVWWFTNQAPYEVDVIWLLSLICIFPKKSLCRRYGFFSDSKLGV